MSESDKLKHLVGILGHYRGVVDGVIVDDTGVGVRRMVITAFEAAFGLKAIEPDTLTSLQQTKPTHLSSLIEMLDRTAVDHGTRDDHDGEAVLIESEEVGDGREWTLVEFKFDQEGNLKEVTSQEGVEG